MSIGREPDYDRPTGRLEEDPEATAGEGNCNDACSVVYPVSAYACRPDDYHSHNPS